MRDRICVGVGVSVSRRDLCWRVDDKNGPGRGMNCRRVLGLPVARCTAQGKSERGLRGAWQAVLLLFNVSVVAAAAGLGYSLYILLASSKARKIYNLIIL